MRYFRIYGDRAVLRISSYYEAWRLCDNGLLQYWKHPIKLPIKNIIGIEDNSPRNPTMATDGDKIYYNSNFCEKLTKDEVGIEEIDKETFQKLVVEYQVTAREYWYDIRN